MMMMRPAFFLFLLLLSSLSSHAHNCCGHPLVPLLGGWGVAVSNGGVHQGRNGLLPCPFLRTKLALGSFCVISSNVAKVLD